MNYTVKPHSGNDHQRIIDWAARQFIVVESTGDQIVFGFGKESLKANSTYAQLKRIANFDVL